MDPTTTPLSFGFCTEHALNNCVIFGGSARSKLIETSRARSFNHEAVFRAVLIAVDRAKHVAGGVAAVIAANR